MCADIEIQANEILHHKLTLNGYLAEFTGQSMETITQVGTRLNMAHDFPREVVLLASTVQYFPSQSTSKSRCPKSHCMYGEPLD